MKKTCATFFCVSLLVFILGSCGTYRYYMPTANPALFKEKGEVHIAGDIGTSGASAKAAFSITNSIGIMTQYNSGIGRNRSHDFEIAAGHYKAKERGARFLAGGVGFGNNFGYSDTTYSIKDYEGNFIRPFIQFNTGITGGKIIGRLRGDAVFCLKASYLMYDGHHLDASYDKISSRYMLIEPAFMVGLGSRIFHFDMIYGFPLHPTFDGLNKHINARTFPMNISFGIRFLFGRTLDAKKE